MSQSVAGEEKKNLVKNIRTTSYFNKRLTLILSAHEQKKQVFFSLDKEKGEKHVLKFFQGKLHSSK